MTAPIRIGCSGWHYAHWREVFYPRGLPSGQWLDHYARHFDSVEINNSFYKLPNQGVFECWRDTSPPGFLFAVKASRFITHNLKLSGPFERYERFFQRVTGLPPKLGPILFQLPPRWRVNAARLAEFIDGLPSDYRYAFEFRNENWWTDAVLRILSERRCAWCTFDIGERLSPIEVTTDFTYIRLHGPVGRYGGSYSDAALADWADRCRAWAEAGRAVYLYFDNDAEGNAVRDALRLKAVLGR